MNKKRLLLASLIFLSGLGLASCGGSTTNSNADSSSSDISTENSTSTNELNTYKASLKLGRASYKNEATVIFILDDGSKIEAKTNKDGEAIIKTDKVAVEAYLKDSLADVSYIPHDNLFNGGDNLDLKLYKLNNPKTGTGNDLYEALEISATGFYRAVVNEGIPTYYDFKPTKTGKYSIETMVDCRNDNVDPGIDFHLGTPEFKPFMPTSMVFDGGYTTGGYTVNAKDIMEIDSSFLNDQQLYTFGIKGESKDNKYPMTIDFKITFEGELDSNPETNPDSNPDDNIKVVVAKEASKAKPTIDTTGKTYFNIDGGTGNYVADGITNGSGIIDGAMVKLKEDEGIYYIYKDGKFVTPLLCAITVPSCFYSDAAEDNGAFSQMESDEYPALTIRNENREKVNYKDFIERDYANASVGGYTYVTEELRLFLERFFNSSHLNFMLDGFEVSVINEGEWLFACGYYK